MSEHDHNLGHLSVDAKGPKTGSPNLSQIVKYNGKPAVRCVSQRDIASPLEGLCDGLPSLAERNCQSFKAGEFGCHFLLTT